MKIFRMRKRKLLLFIFLIFIGIITICFVKSNHPAKNKRTRLQSKLGLLGPREDPSEEKEYSISELQNLATIYTAEDQRNYDSGYRKNAFNQMLSDKLSYTRPLPDVRSHQCKIKEYQDSMPQASVIICFIDEALSVLLRTVHTVLERSPEHLIHEIILIDDNSNFQYLQAELQNYISENLPKVKLIRSEQRLGLIKARLLGAKESSGKALVFLDSHCEVNVGWLEPLLLPLASHPQTVTVPIMDIINADTFMYETSAIVKGGFNWGMHYQWIPLTKEQKTNISLYPEPFPSPTMAGGLFAIDRNYFHNIGEYDKGMEIWGGENLEISFRIWQCGGRLVIVPCSRVGHIFRKRRPYGSPVYDSFVKNSLRVVHVWMDDYKKYFFHVNPRAQDVDYGNIHDRVELRKTMQCKSFKWYLENIYPEQTFPDLKENLFPNKSRSELGNLNKSPVRRRGKLKHSGSGLCVESEAGIYSKRSLLRLAICKSHEVEDQKWYETEQKDLRLANLLCLDVNEDEGPYARLLKCRGSKAQTWQFERQGSKEQLINFSTNKCLSATGVDPGALLKLTPCVDSPMLEFTLQ